jgi:hypothetical protein
MNTLTDDFLDYIAILSQKANAWTDKGDAMKVLHRVQDDGRVELIMPEGVPPDTAGYNRNVALQKQKKTMAAARLRAKLEAKKAQR